MSIKELKELLDSLIQYEGADQDDKIVLRSDPSGTVLEREKVIYASQVKIIGKQGNQYILID